MIFLQLHDQLVLVLEEVVLLQIFPILGQIGESFGREVHVSLLISLHMLGFSVLVLLILTLLVDPFLVLEVALALIVARELHLTIILQQLTNGMSSYVDVLGELALIFWSDPQNFFFFIMVSSGSCR